MYNQIHDNDQPVFKTTIHGSQEWISRLHQITKATLYNPKMSNTKMAEELEISERDLFRKIKNMTGLSPQKYLRRYRLQHAMQLLKEGQYRTVKETANVIGYSNVSHFILQFEKEFGKKPLRVLKEQGWR